MDMPIFFSLCALVVVFRAPVSCTSKTSDIILTPVNSQVTYSFNSSEPVCNSSSNCNQFGTCCYTCDVYVSSPSGTILNVTFLALQIPSNNRITFINRNTSEDLLSLSGVYSVIDPIYSDSSYMKISIDWCDDTTPYSYLEAEFSFLDRFQDSLVRSSGGAYQLSNAYPSITIESVDLSSLTDLEGQLNWFITSSNYTWIKIDVLDMEPGEGELCIFDTFETFGDWVCMTDSVSSTTWYSYDDELRMTFFINQNERPGVGLTVKLSIIDHSLWTGQYLILPTCNPTVILEDTQTIQFATPYFNQSLQNVRYRCRMILMSRDAPASVEFMHFDFPGQVSIYSLESPGDRVDLADATGTQVNISPHAPVISLSPTHEIILDVDKTATTGDGDGLMIQAYTFDHDTEPIASFGIAIGLNDTSFSRAFTTLGYPKLPGGDSNIRWFIDRELPNTVIKVEFIDFDIGTANLFVHEMDDRLIFQFNGSSLPDDIYSDTEMLTLVLRSNQPCCTRGFYFNVTLIQDVDECTNAPCDNGGTCTDTLESFRCTCPVGFTGRLCQNLITTVAFTSGSQTTQWNTDTTTITSARSSPLSETSTPIKSTIETSTSRRTTTSRIETTISTLPYQPVSEEQSPDDTNILIIALVISISIAFVLIALLVCVVVYRSSRQAPVAALTNSCSPCSPPGHAGDNPSQRYEQPIPNNNSFYITPIGPLPPPPPPSTPPPAYEEIVDNGVYVELDENAMRHSANGGYDTLRETPSVRGTHQNPPDSPRPTTPITTATPITPDSSECMDMRDILASGTVWSRDSDGSHMHVERNAIEMNSRTTPPLYDSHIQKTTTFHS